MVKTAWSQLDSYIHTYIKFNIMDSFSHNACDRRMDTGTDGIAMAIERCILSLATKLQRSRDRHHSRTIWFAHTYYSAESLSWYSRARPKHSCTPGSFHSRFMISDISVLRSLSSALARENSWRESSYRINIPGGPKLRRTWAYTFHSFPYCQLTWMSVCTWRIGNCLCCGEWSRDRWRQATVWRHSDDITQHDDYVAYRYRLANSLPCELIGLYLES